MMTNKMVRESVQSSEPDMTPAGIEPATTVFGVSIVFFLDIMDHLLNLFCQTHMTSTSPINAIKQEKKTRTL
ncbi:Uncharacterised protein [Streptococcus dysgalactiae]|nr:Uncharacterised protein [Streptococcus dysgalactiae]